MRYRLPFAIPPVNWSQLPAARLITLVPKSPHCALLVDAWASTPRPAKQRPRVRLIILGTPSAALGARREVTVKWFGVFVRGRLGL